MGCLVDGGVGRGGGADFVGGDFAGFVDDDPGGDGLHFELGAGGWGVDVGPGVAVGG